MLVCCLLVVRILGTSVRVSAEMGRTELKFNFVL